MKKKKKSQNTGQRVRALRKSLSMTQAALGRRMGYARNYISLIENGREPSRRFRRELELLEQAPIQHFEHTPVIHEDTFSSAPPDQPKEPGQTGITTGVIPLLSWAQAGTTQTWDELDGHDGFVGFNLRDSKAVAIQIRGDAMAPQFPHDSIAIVYPGWTAKSGDLVIARLKDGTVIFKRFHVDGNHYTFISLNLMYPPQTVEKSKVDLVLPVGGTYQSHL